jgi:hypothetical protein
LISAKVVGRKITAAPITNRWAYPPSNRVMRSLLLSVLLALQSAPAFDVSSIKLNTAGPEAPVRFEPLPGGRLTTTNTTLRMVAAWAHGVQFFQMVGGPDWVDSARFDISAKVDGNPTTTEMRVMLRELLKDRFKLTVSTGSREMSVYALTVARPGVVQLKPSMIDCTGTPTVGAASCEFSYQLGNVHAEGNDRASSVQLQAEDYHFPCRRRRSLPSGYCRSANENSDWPAATPMYCRPLTA